MKTLFTFPFFLLISIFANGQALREEKTKTMNANQKIKVLELRNYLLKPNSADKFREYFRTHFVEPMTALGGLTMGQFKIQGVNDRFVWLRGFNDMHARLNFLNNFYLKSPTWKKFGPDANKMIVNSDNVYLLKPLNDEGSVYSREFETEKGIVVVDFYICNSTLDKVSDLFNREYLPFIKSTQVTDVSLWVSEMTENDFPRLPVFQDKNLLVSITRFNDKREYRTKSKLLNSPSVKLRNAMNELITVKTKLVLYSTVN